MRRLMLCITTNSQSGSSSDAHEKCFLRTSIAIQSRESEDATQHHRSHDALEKMKKEPASHITFFHNPFRKVLRVDMLRNRARIFLKTRIRSSDAHIAHTSYPTGSSGVRIRQRSCRRKDQDAETLERGSLKKTRFRMCFAQKNAQVPLPQLTAPLTASAVVSRRRRARPRRGAA